MFERPAWCLLEMRGEPKSSTDSGDAPKVLDVPSLRGPMNPSVCLFPSLLLTCVAAQAQSSFRVTRFADWPATTSPAMLAKGDIDGDGDLDLLVANDYWAVTVLINDGNGMLADETATRFASPTSLDNHCIDLVDIDGDGDLDCLLGNEDFVPNYVCRNNGAGVFAVDPAALPTQADDTRHQVLADFDNDGDVDWLTIDGGGSHYYENNGAGVFSDQTATRLSNVPTNLGYAGLVTPQAVDFDLDGDLDVLIPGAGGLLLNVAGVLTSTATQLPAFALVPHWVVDVDGDGDADVLGGNGRQLLLNQGNATFIDVTGTALPAAPTYGYGCFDVDGDGDVDVLRGGTIDYNDGTGVFAAVPSSQAVSSGAVRGHVAADYDGDGDLDLPGLSNLLHHVDAPTPPQIGGAYTVELHARPGSATPGLIVGAFGAGAVMLPWGLLRIDPVTAVVVASSPSITTPLQATFSIPNVPALVGTNLHYQGVHLDPVRGILLTNSFGDAVL